MSINFGNVRGERSRALTTLMAAVLMGCGAAPEDADEAMLDEPPVVATTQALTGVDLVGTASRSSGSVSYDATNAYFGHSATVNCSTTALIEKMNLSTGARTTLSSGNCVSAFESASNGTTLYYVDEANRDIRRIPVQGGSDTKYVDIDLGNLRNGLAPGSNYIVWGDREGLHFSNAPNSETLWIENPSSEGAIQVLGFDGTWWYYQACLPAGCATGRQLWRFGIFVGNEVIYTQTGSFDADFVPFAMDSTHLYWQAYLSSTQQYRLRRLQKSDLTVGSLRTTNARIQSIAANESYVYWLEGTEIRRYRKSDNTSRVEVSGVVTGGNLGLTSSRLFWTEENRKELWRGTLP